MQEPRVLNRHHFKDKAEIPAPWVYVGRGTPLGNPFPVKEHGPEACMRLYKKWLWNKIQANDPDVLGALAAITPEHGLVCSCAPRPCHADAIVSAWKMCHAKGVFYEEAERAAMADPAFH